MDSNEESKKKYTNNGKKKECKKTFKEEMESKKFKYQPAIFQDNEENYLNILLKRDVILHNICDKLEVVSILEPIGKKSTRKVKLLQTSPDGKQSEIIMDFANLYKIDLFSKELVENGFMLVHPAYISELLSYVAVGVRTAQTNKQYDYIHSGLGWHTLENGQRIFLLEDVIGSNITSKFEKDNFQFSKGSELNYDEFIKDTILQTTPLQLALVLGLSSIVISLLQEHTGIKTVLLDIVGQSSTGKSTIQEFICSLYGNPRLSNNGLFRTFNGTANSFISANEGMHGVSIVIDDASTKEGSINWEEFIYQMSAGESKSRCTTTGALQKNNDDWDGMVIISSEHCILENMRVKQGATVRLLVAEDVQWTQSAEEAKHIKSFVKRNFGFTAKQFVSKLIELLQESDALDELYNRYDDEFDNLLSKITHPDNLSPRICQQLALISLTGNLVNELLQYDIDTDAIMENFIQRENAQSLERDISERAFDNIVENVIKNIRRFSSNSNPSTGDCYGRLIYKPNYLRVNILSSVVENWLLTNGFVESKTIKGKWREKNLIKCDSDGRYTIKDSVLHGARVISLMINNKEVEANYPTLKKKDDIIEVPVMNVHYEDDDAIDEIFDDEVSDDTKGQEE